MLLRPAQACRGAKGGGEKYSSNGTASLSRPHRRLCRVFPTLSFTVCDLVCIWQHVGQRGGRGSPAPLSLVGTGCAWTKGWAVHPPSHTHAHTHTLMHALYDPAGLSRVVAARPSFFGPPSLAVRSLSNVICGRRAFLPRAGDYKRWVVQSTSVVLSVSSLAPHPLSLWLLRALAALARVTMLSGDGVLRLAVPRLTI